MNLLVLGTSSAALKHMTPNVQFLFPSVLSLSFIPSLTHRWRMAKVGMENAKPSAKPPSTRLCVRVCVCGYVGVCVCNCACVCVCGTGARATPPVPRAQLRVLVHVAFGIDDLFLFAFCSLCVLCVVCSAKPFPWET